MKREKKQLVTDIEYEGAASILKPVIYKNGPAFLCALKQGDTEVSGSGDSPHLAVKDWDEKLQQHLRTAGPDDEIVQYVMSLLSETPVKEEAPVPPAAQNFGMEEHISSISDPETASQVRAFYEQFRGFEKKSQQPG